MSVRPNIYGIDLQSFKDLIGSQSSVLNSWLQNYDASLPIIDGQKSFFISESEDHQIITSLVMQPRASAQLVETNHPHLLLQLLTSFPDTLTTDSSDWKEYFYDYFRNLASQLETRPANLISYFLSGRSIFSLDIPKTQYPYAYLLKTEVKELLEAINDHPDLFMDDEGFGEDFKNWLEAISAKNQDLLIIES